MRLDQGTHVSVSIEWIDFPAVLNTSKKYQLYLTCIEHVLCGNARALTYRSVSL